MIVLLVSLYSFFRCKEFHYVRPRTNFDRTRICWSIFLESVEKIGLYFRLISLQTRCDIIAIYPDTWSFFIEIYISWFADILVYFHVLHFLFAPPSLRSKPFEKYIEKPKWKNWSSVKISPKHQIHTPHTFFLYFFLEGYLF